MRMRYSMSIQTIERTTLSNLVYNEPYARKVLPFIKPEYFANRQERVVFEEIIKFVEKYNALPTKSTLEIEIDTRRDLNETDISRILETVKSLKADKEIALTAVKQDSLAFMYVPDKLKSDKEIVLAAIKENGIAFEFASDEIKSNKDIIIKAVIYRCRVFIIH